VEVVCTPVRIADCDFRVSCFSKQRNSKELIREVATEHCDTVAVTLDFCTRKVLGFVLCVKIVHAA
jgi:hypothetical protein